MTAFSTRCLFGIIRSHSWRRCLSDGVCVSAGETRLSTMAYSLTDVVKSLESFAPPSLAESWDNVGLLVEPPSPQQIKRVLLTNDLTEDVLEEALQSGSQFIVSYHPPIFAPLKSITSKSWKEHIIGTLLENKIALYSPHTAWDSVQGGVNDWLADAFALTGKDGVRVEPIHQHYTNATSSHTVSGGFCDIRSAQNCVENIVGLLGKTSYRVLHSDTSHILEIDCIKSNMLPIIELLKNASDIKVTKNEQVPLNHHGSGRKLTLQHSISFQQAINAVKNHLELKDVSIAMGRGKNLESFVSSIVLCAGSGASVLKGLEADLYLTGEMLHHDILDAVHRGTHVILTRHSNSERGFLKSVAEGVLKKALPEIEIVVSKHDRDPLVTA